MDTPESIKSCVEWFFGYGGNHLGLKRVLPSLRPIALCEIEAYAIANMVAKMEKGLLDPTPIWTDCKTFPVELFRGCVDLFVASYPCPGFSLSGKRLGKDDPRFLWPWVYRGVITMRPRYCLFENVEGHLSLGLSTVLSDLEAAGYSHEEGLFSAAEVGAPHQRKRVFILARDERFFAKDTRRVVADTKIGEGGGVCESGLLTYTGDDGGETELANSSDSRLSRGQKPGASAGDAGADGSRSQKSERGGSELADADGAGSQGRDCGGLPKYARQWLAGKVRTRWPVRPGEQQHDWEAPRVTAKPGVDRKLDGNSRELDERLLDSVRVDRLRLCGNGVVPDTAERAFRILFERINKS